jgi:hypothetical protein
MDYGNTTNQFSGNNPPVNSPSDAENWMQQYQNGQGDQVPHHQVYQAYNQWSQGFQPDQVHEATHYGFQQIPQHQLPDVAGAISNFFHQHGLNPQDAGVKAKSPQQMTPQDITNMTRHAQEQQPDAIQRAFQPGGALDNPLVGMALAGALAYGASRFLK